MFYYAAKKGNEKVDNIFIFGYDLENAAENAEHECRKYGLEFLEVRNYTKW